MSAIEGWTSSDSWPVLRNSSTATMNTQLMREDRDRRSGDIPYYGANGLQGYIDDFIFDEPLISDHRKMEVALMMDASRSIAYRIAGKSWA